MFALAVSGNAAPRQAAAALISATVHGLVLLLCAVTSVHFVDWVEPEVIPLVIRQAAAPAALGPSAAPRQAPALAPAVPVAPVIKPARAQARTAPPKPAAKPEPALVTSASPARAPMGRQPSVEAMATGAAGPPAPLAGSDTAGAEAAGGPDGRSGAHGHDALRLDQVAGPPTVVEVVRPVYPAVAKARNLEGIVLVQGIIDRGGKIEAGSARVVESYPPFDEAALEAFRRWRYKAGRDERGDPVRVLIEQQIRFKLR